MFQNPIQTAHQLTLSESLDAAYKVAYRAASGISFFSMALGFGSLYTTYILFDVVLKPATLVDYGKLVEYIAAFGLGTSAMALFGRVGGGIFAKSADVGGDIVGKVQSQLQEPSFMNPVTIADSVGDNAAEVAGMGADIFASLTEAICASLVLIANTQNLIQNGTVPDENILMFPFLIVASGVGACFLTSVIGSCAIQKRRSRQVKASMIVQLLISSLLTLGICVGPVFILPKTWTFRLNFLQKEEELKIGDRFYFIGALAMGLGTSFLIYLSTEYFTSYSHGPVREMALACTAGPAINIIYGLALGYKSTIIPILLIGFNILVSGNLLGMLGIAISAVGMLAIMPIGFTINAFGAICDNAAGISQMAGMDNSVSRVTEGLDGQRKSTSALSKMFSIVASTLVGLVVYASFVLVSSFNTNHPIRKIELTDSWIFGSLLIGAMVPYAFSGMTMTSVGNSAEKMIMEVQKQFNDNRIMTGEMEPDYVETIRDTAKTSFARLAMPTLVIILTPLVFGLIFHPAMVAGLLPGCLLSGVQIAISMCNSGSAWDNCKKFIEGDSYVNENNERKSKGSDEHKAAIIGDVVGDPMKNTSGPSLNVLIKFMAILSLVFAGVFEETSVLGKSLKIQLED